MRLIKMLGLAMVAALATMAFVGAGSASAILCKVKESPCASGNQYPTHTTVLAFSKAIKLKGTFGSLLCSSHMTLLHEGLSGGKLVGKITSLVWSNCTGCNPVETTSSPIGTFKDEATSEGNGKLFPENVTVLMKNCALGAECTMKTTNGTTSLSLIGGTIGGTAKATANTSVTLSGFGCGTATWETEEPYVVTEVNGSKTGSIFQE